MDYGYFNNSIHHCSSSTSSGLDLREALGCLDCAHLFLVITRCLLFLSGELNCSLDLIVPSGYIDFQFSMVEVLLTFSDR